MWVPQSNRLGQYPSMVTTSPISPCAIHSRAWRCTGWKRRWRLKVSWTPAPAAVARHVQGLAVGERDGLLAVDRAGAAATAAATTSGCSAGGVHTLTDVRPVLGEQFAVVVVDVGHFQLGRQLLGRRTG